jgi:hypothetical protein
MAEPTTWYLKIGCQQQFHHLFLNILYPPKGFLLTDNPGEVTLQCKLFINFLYVQGT